MFVHVCVRSKVTEAQVSNFTNRNSNIKIDLIYYDMLPVIFWYKHAPYIRSVVQTNIKRVLENVNERAFD